MLRFICFVKFRRRNPPAVFDAWQASRQHGSPEAAGAVQPRAGFIVSARLKFSKGKFRFHCPSDRPYFPDGQIIPHL
jgi:hypothetical protein